MHIKFEGQLAVITGGASGIGEACVRALAAAGARAVIADKNREAAERCAGALGAAAAELDVGDEASVASAFSLIEAEHGPVEVLINCAGVLQRTLPPDKLSIKEWDLVARIDLRGTYLCCAAAGSRMAARRRGSIVNIASIAGMCSGPLHSYGPAKAGVISLTECLAAEWGPAGVRVNAISPGFTCTPALGKGIATGTLDSETMRRASALQRLVAPEEVAAATLFLASDLASAITGANLPVDAGFLAAAPWQVYGGLRDVEKNEH